MKNKKIKIKVSQQMQQVIDFGDGSGGGTDYGTLVGPAFTNPYVVGLLIYGYFADR